MKRASDKLGLDEGGLSQFCARHHIHKLSLFGSVAQGVDRPDSDIDILVEFDPDYRVGFIRLARIERELSEKIGRKVDMRTSKDLSRYFRQEVVQSAELQYAKG